MPLFPAQMCELPSGARLLSTTRGGTGILLTGCNSHICAGRSGTIYCFIGGSPKS